MGFCKTSETYIAKDSWILIKNLIYCHSEPRYQYCSIGPSVRQKTERDSNLTWSITRSIGLNSLYHVQQHMSYFTPATAYHHSVLYCTLYTIQIKVRQSSPFRYSNSVYTVPTVQYYMRTIIYLNFVQSPTFSVA